MISRSIASWRAEYGTGEKSLTVALLTRGDLEKDPGKSSTNSRHFHWWNRAGQKTSIFVVKLIQTIKGLLKGRCDLPRES
jgi:hypothetical protein